MMRKIRIFQRNNQLSYGFAACRGGWPGTFKARTDKARLKTAANYFKSVCDEDINRVDDKSRDSEIARYILKSYARNISTLAKKSVMIADASAARGTLSETTWDDYIQVFERLFVIEDMIVLTGGQMAYRRDDGVYVIPLACLKD